MPDGSRPVGRRVWLDGPDWADAAVVIMASGPSLSVEQVAAVYAWRTAEGMSDRRRVIVINTTFRLAPWADMLFACDMGWWTLHIAEAREDFRGELWTQDLRAQLEYKVRRVQSVRSEGLGRKPGVIHQGHNSGFMAINLAWQCGASRIVLLGFDMRDVDRRSHWHGDHPKPLNLCRNFPLWIAALNALAADLRVEGTDVVNCTPGSALTCFPMRDLREELCKP